MTTQVFYKILPEDKRSKHFALRNEAFQMLTKGNSRRKVRRSLKISHRQMKKLLRRCWAYTDRELPSAAYYINDHIAQIK